jgi:D-glycero-D-manno-heptose 1,7-bisphosphate phosphatase
VGKHPITRRAVFLDRDGVLNRPMVRDLRPYPPTRLDDLTLYEDAREACARLKVAGFRLIVVTNQPDVGRGTLSRATVEAMHEVLRRDLPTIDSIEVCYHAGARYGEPCACRKPSPGMLLRAAVEFNLDLHASYLVGDRWRDVDCARAAGCRAIFIDCGYEEQLRAAPDFVAHTLTEAVDFVLREIVAESTCR